MDKNNIMPFHLFNYQGNNYVINIENMRASSVDEITASNLKRLAADPKASLTSSIEASLNKLGLISDGGTKIKNPPRKESFSIINMALLLTQSCNLRCTYCYGDGGEYGTGGTMDEKTALQAVDWLIEQSGKVKKIGIVFFGGEPFINFPLMKKVVEYAEQRVIELDKRVSFSVTTNATLLDDDKISFLKEHNIHIIISIDGPKEIQDKQRPFAGGKGSYDVILPKVKKLLEVIPDTRAHAVLVDDLKTHIVKDALQEMGFSEVSIMPASASLFDDELEKAKQARKLKGVLEELELEAKAWLMHTKNRDPEALKKLISNSQLSQSLLSFLHNQKKQHACGAGLKFVGVSCSGDIYLCHRFVGMEDYRLGNIFSKTIDREKYLESPITQMEECINCFAKHYCAGGCKHDNAGSCGSGFKPSEDMCNMKRHEVELAAATVSMFDEGDSAFLMEYEIFPPKPCPLDL